MKRARIYAAALLLASLTGCAELVVVPRAVDETRIERWLQEQRYGKVLEVLERRAQRSDELDAEKRLEEVRALASQYDKEEAKAANQLLDAGKLNKAEGILNQALGRYPDGQQLQQAAQKLRQLRQEKIDALEAELLLVQADWLSASVPIFEQLAQVEPSNLDAIWQAKRMEQERRDVAQRLASIGLTAHANGDNETAKRYLTASKRLLTSEPVDDVLKHLGKQEKQKQDVRKAQKQEIASKKRREEADRLAQQARQELQYSQLLAARDHVEQLQEVDPEYSQLHVLRFQLVRAIDARVASLLRTGDDHYAEGRIAEAKRLWEAGLALSPGHAELTKRVERAERVLARLRELREDNNGGS